MNFIMIAVLVLGAIALIAALVLFVVSKKFAVDEDPRLGQVGEILPGANCGGCGFAGCSGKTATTAVGTRKEFSYLSQPRVFFNGKLLGYPEKYQRCYQRNGTEYQDSTQN